MDNKKLYGTATVGTKGQIVIPASAREQLGIKTGDRLYVVGSHHQGVVALLMEDKVEKFIEKMNLQFENLKNLSKKEKDNL